MDANFTRWTSPILGEEAESLYKRAYGEDGVGFVSILETSPYEIAVISRMIAYLHSKKEGEKQHGYDENR